MTQYVVSTLTGILQGQVFKNVFTYSTDNDTSSQVAAAFNEAFENYSMALAYSTGSLLHFIAGVSTADTVFNSINSYNPINPLDFEDYPLTQNGPITPPSAGPETAISYRSQRVSRQVRRAHKRFTGIPEAEINGGNLAVSSAGYQNAMNDLASALGQAINGTAGGVTMTFTPIVVKRESYVTPKGKTAYRLPQDQAGWDSSSYSVQGQWQVGERTTTQYSRKRPQVFVTSV